MRYNEQLGRNRGLRARIDGLRRERLLFEELAGKLGRGLERQKAAMLEVIGRIAEAHEAREKVRLCAVRGGVIGVGAAQRGEGGAPLGHC